MELIEATEGKTTFFVPVQDTDTQFPPSSAAIFFNRRMQLNRDATVLLLSILKPSDYLDAMGATGVRGLRVANECGVPVTINDRDETAIPVIRRNADRNSADIEITNRDINALLSERSFDAVDLDPFGSPATFIDAAIRGCRRFLLVTATDTAPLCGAHLKAGIRRYDARPGNTEYHSEVGLRILLGFVVRQTVKYDRGIDPLFCFAREHFVRLHLRITRGAKAGDESLSHIGYIMQCPSCPYREEHQGRFPPSSTCPHCGKQLDPIGPLWLGSLMKPEILDQMNDLPMGMELGTKKELQKIIATCREELPTSSFYDYHHLAQILKGSPPDITVVLDRLRADGYAATRTHFCGTGIKTDAPLSVIFGAIRG
ncbi:MAG: tRNA (guanine(10)-N(2))-dimethyltransferase [Methanoregula sp.]|jgi:tRNA (guanine26-N2/guanine27-N2)-dimethyltransferase